MVLVAVAAATGMIGEGDGGSAAAGGDVGDATVVVVVMAVTSAERSHLHK